VVGGEFSSTIEDVGHDDVVNTFIQDMSVVCIEEVRESMETNSQVIFFLLLEVNLFLLSI
jgi:hypothetical protein